MNQLTISTPYGDVVANLYGNPSSVYQDSRGRGLTEDHPLSIGARIVSPQITEGRGYIDGRAGYHPLTINGVPYRLDMTAELGPAGWATPTGAATSGYWPRLERLTLTERADVGASTFGADPTDKARRALYDVIVPAVHAALNNPAHLDAIDEARGAAVSAYADSVAALERELRALIGTAHDRLRAHRVTYSATPCPREDCGHARALHTGPGRSCEVARGREACLCYRFGTWTPSGPALAAVLDAAGV